MGKWREAFDYGRPSVLDVEFGYQYHFGPPAADEQLAAAEKELGRQLPPDLRALLSEFNGVWVTTEAGRRDGSDPDITYLDTDFMAVEAPRYFRTCGNPLPPAADLERVVFFYQENGFGDLYGVCAEAFAGFRQGEVVHVDHNVGELESSFASLLEFVRHGCRDWE